MVTTALARVDWRFLLDDPNLGAVALLGTPDAVLLAGLRLITTSITFDPSHEDLGQYDVVVICAPSRDHIRTAAALLRPGGHLYLELPRSASSVGLRRGTWRRCIAAAGFDELVRSWHLPTFATSSHVIPLGDPAAMRTVARRHQGSIRGSVKGHVLRAAATTGTATLIARDVSIIARRTPMPGA
jgi:hypothetical protein